jgi:diadenosine tetraphosphate (Ap4A) HIT family hydrolase
MNNCYFCQSIQTKDGLDFVAELETELFIATWDINPVTPGHMLIIPKRHVQYMQGLSIDEQESLIKVVKTAKQLIQRIDLQAVYTPIARRMLGTKSEDFINLALSKLQDTKRPPEAFNDGLNDGPAAGQTVPHFHWHIMPRWQGDTEDFRGGIRHMFPGVGNYL